MSHNRILKPLLVVLALALWAGTAIAQPTATTPSNLTFTPGGGGNVLSVTSSIGGNATDAYSAAIVYNGTATGWLTATPGTGTLPDTLTIALNTGVAATLPAATDTATITISDPSDPSGITTVPFTVTLVVTGTLTAPTTSVSLNYVFGGTTLQAAATKVITVTNTDTSYDSYTVVGTTCPAWLTWTSVPVLQAKAGTTSALTFIIDSTQFAGTTSANVAICSVALKYNGGTFDTITFTKLAIVSQPLLATAPTALLTYNKGTQATVSNTAVTISVATGTPSGPLFNLDIATLPAWLSVQSGLTNNAASAIVAGSTVTFALNTTVAPSMATGNYVANVGFFETGFPDLQVPVALQISNAAATATIVPATNQAVSVTSSMATPAPTWQLYSTNEPIPFTGTCTVTHTAATYTPTTGFTTPCMMTGAATGSTNVINGTAFTWGYALMATLDPALFTVQIGNTVTVTMTFTNMSSAAPGPIQYVYTVQPGVPTATATSPSSMSANFSRTTSPVVVVKGTNFIGTGSISGTSVVQTQVWIGGTLLTSGNAATLGSYYVMDASNVVVTLAPATLPVVASGHTGSVVIGVANQTGAAAPIAPQATATLNVTFAPVVYSMTSTASYIQPSSPGGAPSFAPFELISIFGDNFGLTGSASASAVFDAYDRVTTPFTLIPAVGSVHAVTMTVTFKDVATGKISLNGYLLFANQNQINVIVPSGVVVGTAYNVTVTAGTATSDNFLVNAVAADPGIFTLASDGTGTGAIIDATTGVIVSGGSNKGHVNDVLSIYLTGLGMPDSTGLNVVPTAPYSIPGSCVAINGTTGSPGLLQVVNTTVKAQNYTSPAWTNIDGAVMNDGPHDILEGTSPNLNFPPCMATAVITVTFGTATNNVAGTVTFAGFVTGTVVGLYQINVTVPASLTPGGGTLLSGATPVTVTITTTAYASNITRTTQAGVVTYF